jgi:MFS family permease
MHTTTAVPSSRRAGPFVNRNFGLLWLGQTISVIGDFVFDTTLVVWIATSLAKNQSWAPLAVSGVLLATSVPVLLVGPIAGVFVDRWNKRRTMLVMDILRVLLVLALLPATGLIPLPGLDGAQISIVWKLGAVYAVVFLLNVCGRFFRPASLALVGDLVPEAQQARAVGMLQTSASLAVLIGPALATPLLVAFGPYWALGINALSFLVSFVTILAVAAPREAKRASAKERGSFAREFFDGIGYFFRSRVLRALGIGAFIVMLGGGGLNALDIFFVTDNLHATPALFGLLATAQGVGMLLGAVLAGAFAERIGIIRTLWGGLVLAGISMVAYSRMTSFGPALAVLLVAGVPLAALNVAAGPMILRSTPRSLVGRISSVLDPMIMLATILGSAVAGYLDSTLLHGFSVAVSGLHFGPVDTIFTAAGILAVVSGLYVMLALRGVRLREGDSRDPAERPPEAVATDSSQATAPAAQYTSIEA